MLKFVLNQRAVPAPEKCFPDFIPLNFLLSIYLSIYRTVFSTNKKKNYGIIFVTIITC